MKILMFLTFLAVLFLTACQTATPPPSEDDRDPAETPALTLEPIPQHTATATVIPDTPTPTLEPTLTPSFTTTTIPDTPTQVPRKVQTGIPQVDAVIEAVLSNDLETRQALVRFVTSGCTTADGLGGPPKCKDDQADGTLVDYLPLGGPGEGSHALASEVDRFLRFEADTLYAAYLVSDDMPDNPEYPFGTYALMFTIFRSESGIESVVVRVDDEGYIVRLDFLGGIPLDFYFQQMAADLMERPPEMIMFSSEAAEILVYPPE